MSLRLAALVLVGSACARGSPAPVGGEPSASGAGPPAPRPDAAPADVECVRDGDCVLLPEVTCCGECPPVPPFEVGTVAALDAVLIESEQICAERRVACEATPACDPVPRGCYARAECIMGACVLATDGCGRPLS